MIGWYPPLWFRTELWSGMIRLGQSVSTEPCGALRYPLRIRGRVHLHGSWTRMADCGWRPVTGRSGQ